MDHASTPRRPVILKSDRESSKDQTKDKNEKEKQPTIILKTREQSASKEDRPISPKHTEAEISHPAKIAHNESKEKKDPRVSQPLKLMTEPVKLLDENLDFNTAALEFLTDSNNSYLVVGVLGTQGVGKSMILNILSQKQSSPDLANYILHSHEANNEPILESNDVPIEKQLDGLNFIDTPDLKVLEKNTFCKFKMQDIEQIEKGTHCTRGVDMYVTTDRVILLDCQALWSPSLIEDTNTNPVTARSANIVTVDCLQIASYLMAICHVVIAVQDWFIDYNFVRYIQAAEMLQPSLSGGGGAVGAAAPGGADAEAAGGGETNPHLLLLHNRCHLEDFTPESVKAVQDFYTKAFQRSNLQLTSGMHLGDSGDSGGSGDTHINLFLMPEIYTDHDNHDIYRGHPSFESLAKRLRWTVYGVNRHQITNVPNLTEKGWFHYCNKAWEIVRKCTFFMEYERFLP